MDAIWKAVAHRRSSSVTTAATFRLNAYKLSVIFARRCAVSACARTLAVRLLAMTATPALRAIQAMDTTAPAAARIQSIRRTRIIPSTTRFRVITIDALSTKPKSGPIRVRFFMNMD